MIMLCYIGEYASSIPLSELRNVNSFTRSKTLELNFTPRKARKSRQFWDPSETKLTKIIVFTPTSKYFYTDISVISVTFRNSALW